MADEFSEEIVEQAWARSGGKCECELTGHGHIGKHNTSLLKSYRGDRGNSFGWEAHSVIGSHLQQFLIAESFVGTRAIKQRYHKSLQITVN